MNLFVYSAMLLGCNAISGRVTMCTELVVVPVYYTDPEDEGASIAYSTRLPDCDSIGGRVATRACTRKTMAAKRFQACIAAADLAEMRARGKYILSQLGPLGESCTFHFDEYVAGGTAVAAARKNLSRHILCYDCVGHGAGCEHVFWQNGDFVKYEASEGIQVTSKMKERTPDVAKVDGECIPAATTAMCACIREARAAALFLECIAAGDRAEMNARRKHIHSRWRLVGKNCVFPVVDYVVGGIAMAAARRNVSRHLVHYYRAGHGDSFDPGFWPDDDFVKHGELESIQVSSQVNECTPDVAKAMGDCIAAANTAICACTRETTAAALFLACLTAADPVEMNARSECILSQWRPIGANCAFPLGGYVAGGIAVAAARRIYPRHILHHHHASQGAGSEHGFWQGDDFAKHDESEGIRISCQKHECTRGVAKAMSECIPAVVTAMCACVGSVAAQACHDGREAQEATGACRAMSLAAPSRALGLEFFLWCLSQHFLSLSSAKTVRFDLEIARSLLRRFCLSSFLRSGYVFGVCQLVVGPLRAVLGLFGEPGGARVHQGQLGSGGKSPSSPGVDFVKHGEPEGTQVSSQVNECIPDVAKAMGECIAAASLAMCACTRETRAATLFLACIAAAARVEMHARSKRILSRWRPIGASCALPLGGYMAGGSAVAAARSTYPRHILHRHHASQGAGSEHGFWQGDDFAKHDESEGIRISCQKHECTRGVAKAMSECIPAVVTAMCACVGSVAAQACHDGREAQEATGACRAMSLAAPSRALGLEFFLWCLSQHFLSLSSAKTVRFDLEIARSLLRRFCLSSFLRSGYVFGVCQLVVGPLRAVLGLFGEPGGARVHQGQLGSGGKSPSSPGVDFVKHGEPEGTQVSSQVNECIPGVAKAMGECIAAEIECSTASEQGDAGAAGSAGPEQCDWPAGDAQNRGNCGPAGSAGSGRRTAPEGDVKGQFRREDGELGGGSIARELNALPAVDGGAMQSFAASGGGEAQPAQMRGAAREVELQSGGAAAAGTGQASDGRVGPPDAITPNAAVCACLGAPTDAFDVPQGQVPCQANVCASKVCSWCSRSYFVVALMLGLPAVGTCNSIVVFAHRGHSFHSSGRLMDTCWCPRQPRASAATRVGVVGAGSSAATWVGFACAGRDNRVVRVDGLGDSVWWLHRTAGSQCNAVEQTSDALGAAHSPTEVIFGTASEMEEPASLGQHPRAPEEACCAAAEDAGEVPSTGVTVAGAGENTSEDGSGASTQSPADAMQVSANGSGALRHAPSRGGSCAALLQSAAGAAMEFGACSGAPAQPRGARGPALHPAALGFNAVIRECVGDPTDALGG